MRQSRVAVRSRVFAVLAISLLLGSFACGKKEPPAAVKAEAPQPAAPAPPPPAEASLIPPEEVSEASAAPPTGKLVLPVSFQRSLQLGWNSKSANPRIFGFTLTKDISIFHSECSLPVTT
jgi:hypothetical protein